MAESEGGTQTVDETLDAEDQTLDAEDTGELLVEEVSIDGMCGVY